MSKKENDFLITDKEIEKVIKETLSKENHTDAWQDLWSPSALLRRRELSALLGCSTVHAVGPDPNGNPADIIIAASCANASTSFAPVADLYLAVNDGFEKMRNVLHDCQTISGQVGTRIGLMLLTFVYF